MNAQWHALFPDREVREEWAKVTLDCRFAAHLHGHGVIPDRTRVGAAYHDAMGESGYPRPGFAKEVEFRTALTLVHPHLTRADRDAITAAGLTLTEIDHLIATGTYHRGTLHLIGALT